MIRSRRPSLSVSQPSPCRSMVPGVKLSMTTSAQAASLRASVRPPSVERSSAMPSFEELKLPKNWVRLMSRTPSLYGGAERRMSTRFADSTCTTVAPWSPSPLAISGPTPTHEKSATLSPSKARARRPCAGAPRRTGGAGSPISAFASPRAGAGSVLRSGVRLSLANGPACGRPPTCVQ